MTDALVSASIKNNLTTPDQITYWRNTLFQNGTPTDSQVLNSLNNILSDTTIKRACCLGGPDPNNFSVNVKFPSQKITQPKFLILTANSDILIKR